MNDECWGMIGFGKNHADGVMNIEYRISNTEYRSEDGQRKS